MLCISMKDMFFICSHKLSSLNCFHRGKNTEKPFSFKANSHLNSVLLGNSDNFAYKH